MKKIRINELARELEVKPGVILEMLPELGVQEKKTHSSSVDEDVALELRRRLLGPDAAPRQTVSNGDHRFENEGEDRAEEAQGNPEASETIAAAAGSRLPEQQPPAAAAQTPRSTEPLRVSRPPLQPLGRPVAREGAPTLPFIPATPRPAAPPQPAAPPLAASPAAHISSEGSQSTLLTNPNAPAPPAEEKPAVSFRPLRPPLGSGTGAIHPPLAHTQTSMPGPVNRNVSIPARPLPPSRPNPSAPGVAGPGSRFPRKLPNRQSPRNAVHLAPESLQNHRRGRQPLSN